MRLTELIKRLKDMQLLFGEAVIEIKDDKDIYRIKSINGFLGKQLSYECREPNVVVINVKSRKTAKEVEINNKNPLDEIKPKEIPTMMRDYKYHKKRKTNK